MPIKNDIFSNNSGAGMYDRLEVADDTYNVTIKDIRDRHVAMDKYTGEPKDVLDIDFEITDGDHKGGILNKGFVNPVIGAGGEGRSTSILYNILVAVHGPATPDLLASWQSDPKNVLNDLIGRSLRVLTKESRVVNYLPAKK